MYRYKVDAAVTGQFPKLVTDYILRNELLKPFISAFPSPEAYKEIIDKRSYSPAVRNVLTEVLSEQYQRLQLFSSGGSELVEQNLKLLTQAQTFTVTTGHQLNIFTGPLFTVYKVITTIKLAAQLKEHYPQYNFVPVFWLATEDHDFAEINHFNLFGKTFTWPYPDAVEGKPVGHLSTTGLDKLVAELKSLNIQENILDIFERGYMGFDNLADATIYIYHELFKQFGLVILQPDEPRLKRIFIDYIQKDLAGNVSYKEVKQTIELLSDAKYTAQVNPREINYFYLNSEGKRERIIKENNYQINNSKEEFNTVELLAELDKSPHRFSPNVITRPLYQEVILPNLAYVGGPSEIAYWLELKGMFEAMQVPFPVVHVRNSFVLIGAKMLKSLQTLGLPLENYFLDESALKRKFHESLAEGSRIEKEILEINALFDFVLTKVETVDKSKVGEWVKRINEQKALIKRLERDFVDIVSQKSINQIDKMFKMRESLLPSGKLAERSENLMGKVKNKPYDFLSFIYENTDPFDQSVTCLEI